MCLGLSSTSLGCLSLAWLVNLGVHVFVRGSLVCPCLGSVSTCLSTILLPWLTVVALSSDGELFLCLVVSTGSYYV